MPIEIHTDHESLKYIQTQPTETLTPQLALWQELLSQYDFNRILHIKGLDNIVADALSLCPDFLPILDLFCLPLALGSFSVISQSLDDLVKEQKSDAFCAELIRLLQSSSYPVLSSRFALTPLGALVWTAKGLERLVVPPAFHPDLLKQAHDSPSLGHRGVDKMYCHLLEAYYWPSMHKDVHQY